MTLLVGGPNGLFQLCFVAPNDGVSRVDDALGGAVVLLQLKDFQFGKVFFKVENVLNVGSAEGVDALGVVSHHTDVTPDRRQLFGNQVLGYIGILKLVYQHVVKALLVLVKHVEVLTEQHIGVKEQVVEVHGVGPEAALHVALVKGGHVRLGSGFVFRPNSRIVAISAPRDQLILSARDAVQYHVSLIYFVIKARLLDNFLDERFRVVGIVDGKIALVADAVGFRAQDTGKYRVKGAHPQITGFVAYHVFNTVAHLLGGLVSKGKG